MKTYRAAVINDKAPKVSAGMLWLKPDESGSLVIYHKVGGAWVPLHLSVNITQEQLDVITQLVTDAVTSNYPTREEVDEEYIKKSGGRFAGAVTFESPVTIEDLLNVNAVITCQGIDADGNFIINLANPLRDTDAVNKRYVDSKTSSIEANYMPKSGGTFTGEINMDGNIISSLGDPISAGDATNKDYVDEGLAGKADKQMGPYIVGASQYLKFTKSICSLYVQAVSNESGEGPDLDCTDGYIVTPSTTHVVKHTVVVNSPFIDARVDEDGSLYLTNGTQQTTVRVFVLTGDAPTISVVSIIGGDTEEINIVSVDEEPTEHSHNLVESGGVYDSLVFEKGSSPYSAKMRGAGDNSDASASFAIAGNKLSHATAFNATAFGNSTASANSALSANNATAGANNSAAFNEGRTSNKSATFAINKGSASGQYSFAAGDTTTASGSKSAAFGQNTVASGDNTFARGSNTLAVGAQSLAEGQNSKALGARSIASGYQVVSSGSNSFVFGKGIETIASFTVSSDEQRATTIYTDVDHDLTGGEFLRLDNRVARVVDVLDSRTIVLDRYLKSGQLIDDEVYILTGGVAYGNTSVVLGDKCNAVGDTSYAEGINTIALNQAEHAEGKYNVSHTGETDADNTQHSIGIGTSIVDRANALEIMANGDAYLIGVGNYNGTNPSSATPINELIGQGGSSDIFWATYGSTTPSEIDAAVAEGKSVMMLYNNREYTRQHGYYFYSYGYPHTVYIAYYATYLNQWDSETITLENTYNKKDNLSFPNNIDYPTTQAVASGLSTKASASDVSDINAKIPAQASAQNQLADKNFVNSSIQTNTATFRGTYYDLKAFVEYSTLEYGTPDNNDYAVVRNVETSAWDADNVYQADEVCLYDDGVSSTKIFLCIKDMVSTPRSITPDQDTEYWKEWMNIEQLLVYHGPFVGTWRFKYVPNGAFDITNWQPEYQVNEKPLTAEQLAALNSGIVSNDVTKLRALPTKPVDTQAQVLTEAQKAQARENIGALSAEDLPWSVTIEPDAGNDYIGIFIPNGGCTLAVDSVGFHGMICIFNSYVISSATFVGASRAGGIDTSANVQSGRLDTTPVVVLKSDNEVPITITCVAGNAPDRAIATDEIIITPIATKAWTELEDTSNKVSSITASNYQSTTQYPCNKAMTDFVNDIVGDIETLLAAI